MMIEKVMIQLGVHFNRKGEELAMLMMQEAKAKAKAKARKPPKDKKPKSQKATCRSGTGNAEDAKREEL